MWPEGQGPMALMKQFKTPADFWSGMVEPDFADCEANKADLRAAFHAAISLFHMHDWVWITHEVSVRAAFNIQRSRPKPDSSLFADALESKYNDFGLIRSIANAAKHLKLENLSRPSRVVNAANHAANTAVHVPGAGVGGYGVGAGYATPGLSYAGHPRVVLSGPNGTNMEFFNVATAVYDMWTTLRARYGWW